MKKSNSKSHLSRLLFGEKRRERSLWLISKRKIHLHVKIWNFELCFHMKRQRLLTKPINENRKKNCRLFSRANEFLFWKKEDETMQCLRGFWMRFPWSFDSLVLVSILVSFSDSSYFLRQPRSCRPYFIILQLFRGFRPPLTSYSHLSFYSLSLSCSRSCNLSRPSIKYTFVGGAVTVAGYLFFQ